LSKTVIWKLTDYINES